MIDIHSHILPGIDDGAKSFDNSLEILRGLRAQGITDIIATPHYVCGSTYVSTAAENRLLLESLEERAEKAGIDINLYLGNEIYIDRDIAKLLRTRTISSLANSNFLLVELPMSGEFPDFEDILVSLSYAGHKVILAHPERYHSVWKDFSILEDLAEQGILFQCNLGSVVGQYGRHAQKTVRKLAKKDMIFAFGTDTHRVRNFEEIPLAWKKLGRYYDDDQLMHVLIQNPRKIIG